MLINESAYTKLLLPGGPSPQNLARALMPRQPYSEAVPSTGGRLHPLPFWKGRGLGSGLRTPSSQEGDRGVEKIYVMNIEEKKADFMRRFKASRKRKAEYIAQMEKRMRDAYRRRTGKEAETFCVL